MLDVGAVAELLSCSPRSVFRLADAGAMPWGVKVAGLRRWRRAELLDWLSKGCPAHRRVGGAR